jgi:hypothetical protein
MYQIGRFAHFEAEPPDIGETTINAGRPGMVL